MLSPKLKVWAFFREERGRDWRHVSRSHIRLSTKLRDRATRARDAVYLKVVDDHEQAYRRAARRDASQSTLSFSASILAIADWCMGAPTAFGELHDRLAASGTHLVSINAGAATGAVVVAMAAPWALLYWFRERLEDNVEWVHCPAAACEYAEDLPPE